MGALATSARRASSPSGTEGLLRPTLPRSPRAKLIIFDLGGTVSHLSVGMAERIARRAANMSVDVLQLDGLAVHLERGRLQQR